MPRPHPFDVPLSRRSVFRGASGAGLLALAALAADGCGSAPSVGPSPESEDFGKDASGEIQFWARSDTSVVPDAIVKRFNAAQSKVKINLTLIPGTQLVTKIATAIRGDSQPDLFGCDDFYGTALSFYGALTDVTAAVNRLPYKASLSPGMVQTLTIDGRHYGVPWESDLSAYWYNKSLFKRAGLDPEQPPTTLDDIVTAAKKINALGHGVKGLAFAGSCAGCLSFTAMPSVWAGGQHLINGEPGKQTANIEGNEALKGMLTDYHEIWADSSATTSSQTQNGSTWGADFLTGGVGILPAGYGTVVGKVPDKTLAGFGLAPLPGATGGKATFVGGDNLSIPAGAHNPSAAWAFVEFALAEAQQLALPTVGYTPVRSDLLTPSYRKKNPLNAIMLGLTDVGYIERSVAANTIFNQPSGPWPSMFFSAVFGGDIEGAIAKGQSETADALAEVNNA